MATSSILGFPRIGRKRQLKWLLEKNWKNKISATDLKERADTLKASHWKIVRDAGITHVPSNDFSLYDHVLDMSVTLGVIPERYGWNVGDNVSAKMYFEMARGRSGEHKIAAMQMTKWFDTNYHYIVPELSSSTEFTLCPDNILDNFRKAKDQGIITRPVVLGPVSFLSLGWFTESKPDYAKLVKKIVTVYVELFAVLEKEGVDWIQVDEPILVLDLEQWQKDALILAYKQLASSSLRIMLTTYFGPLKQNLELATSLPVAGFHIDVTRARDELFKVVESLSDGIVLSLGVIDGRNVMKQDLNEVYKICSKVADAIGKERVIVSSSCSLLHVPIDLESEKKLDNDIKQWLSFAVQKLDEIALVAKALNEGVDVYKEEFEANKRIIADRETSSLINNDAVKKQVNSIDASILSRNSPFAVRKECQAARLNLPLFPTTTIGSFPQTARVRSMRSKVLKKAITEDAYEKFLRDEVKDCIEKQENIGLDVLVHGEFERNDMVQYFGQALEGVAVTSQGWVQSFGSRCVRPPIIYGDVSRDKPMTVDWTTYAQKLSDKPVKGMLTGPITILQWSFVRSDIPRKEVCQQIALAIRAEVEDLQNANVKIIQVDEPALREGLPLRKELWKDHMRWAVDCFKIACGIARDDTQIHTHMCYSDFNSIIESIAELDADVISIETSRSHMELLKIFESYKYPNDIGPGVYDIHSPAIPNETQMKTLIDKALTYIDASQIWVNPDCGLKTRGWDEVIPALENLVNVARSLRKQRSNTARA